MKRSWGIILSILLVSSLVLAGCSNSTTPTAGTTAVGNAPATIKIGAMLI